MAKKNTKKPLLNRRGFFGSYKNWFKNASKSNIIIPVLSRFIFGLLSIYHNPAVLPEKNTSPGSLRL